MSTRRLAAIMFSDIAGYTAMMQADETLGREKARRYRKVLKEQVEAHQGEVLQHYGDGSLSIFQSAVEAAKCAKKVQQELQHAPAVPLRIGIHIGDIVRDGDDIYGDGVNLASRVESLGVPGSVLMTERVIHDLRSHPDLATRSLGKFAFKNVDEPIGVFALAGEGMVIPRPEEMEGKGSLVDAGNASRRKNFMRGLVYGFLGVATGAMIWAGYAMSGGKDQVEQVQVFDEQGNAITRQAPTLEATRRLVMFPLEDQTGTPGLDWYRTGLPTLLRLELEQDMRVYCIPPLSLKEYYADYNYEFLQEIPFSSRIKIAQELFTDHFIDGKILQRNDSLLARLKVFDTQTGQPVLEIETAAADVYQLVDRLHERISASIFPGETTAAMRNVDLPAADLISPLIGVLEKYSRASQLYQTDFSLTPQATEMMEAAIAEDPACAECYSLLTLLYMGNSSADQIQVTMGRALELSAALPERQQFHIKYFYYQLNNAPDKARTLLESWKELYPNDYNPYRLLITYYRQANELDKARKVALEALESGHKGPVLLTLANLYSAMGEYDKAEKYYDVYAQLYPGKTQKMTDLGNLYVNQGELEKARAYFEKLLVVNPAYVPVAVKLANTEARLGHFDQARDMLNRLLATARTGKDSVAIYTELEALHRRLGQQGVALKVAGQKWATMMEYFPEVSVQQMRFAQEIPVLVDLGMDEEYQRRLAALKSAIPTSADVFDCVGNYLYAQHKRDVAAFEKWGNACESTLSRFIGENFQYLSQAALYHLQGDYKQAAETYETYLEKTGSSRTSLDYLLSEVYRKAGKAKDAAAHMDFLLSTDPHQPYWIVEQARNYHALGESAQAREWYEKGMHLLREADPDSRIYQETLAFGKELGGV